MPEDRSDIENQNPMKVEHPKSFNDIVIVQSPSEGISMLDRLDAQVSNPNQQTRFHTTPLDNLVGLKDQEQAKAETLDVQDPKQKRAYEVYQEAMSEIKQRRDEARGKGLLKHVDSVLSVYEQQLSDIRNAQPGTVTPQEVIAFQQLISTVGVPIVPPINDSRLDGISELDFKMRVKSLQGAARVLINNVRSQYSQSPTQIGQGQIANNPDAIGRAVGSAVGAALDRGRLSPEEGYFQFQESERYCASAFTLRPESQTFYTSMTHEERGEVDLRLELMQLVVSKRVVGGNLEGYGKDQRIKEAFNAFTKEEMKSLYNMDGVRSAMELYSEIINNRQNYKLTRQSEATDYSIFECKDRKELETFRRRIAGCHFEKSGNTRRLVANDTSNFLKTSGYEKNVYQELFEKYKSNGLDDVTSRKMAMSKAIDAEQIAFNLLFLGNVFESKDAQWIPQEGDSYARIEPPTLSQPDMTILPLRGEMSPADASIEKHKKKRSEFKRSGTFDLFMYNNMSKALEKAGLEKFDYVQVYKFTGDQSSINLLWQVGTTPDGKSFIRVPDCYPPILVGSFYDETTLAGRSLWDYLGKREEIPWDRPGTPAPWKEYHNRCGAASTVIKYIMGTDKVPDVDVIKRLGSSRDGAVGDLQPWVNDISSALVELRKNDDTQLKRWILYSCVGVKDNESIPRLDTTSLVKDLLEVLGNKNAIYLKYLEHDQLYFPYDFPNKLAVILGFGGASKR